MTASLGFRRLLRDRLEVDRAVVFGVLSRSWTVIAGPVTALLIATQLTSEVQGFYYTFSSLLALQVFAEMGLGVVLIQFASHEWANLRLESGKVVGESDSRARLSAITRIAARWYGIAAPVAILFLVVAGLLFFRSPNASNGHSWRGPWVALCVTTGLTLAMSPFWSILEGANQVRAVYGFRVVQTTLVSMALWSALWLDAGLWAPFVSNATSLALAAWFLTTRYGAFFRSLLQGEMTGRASISWRADMLPMQWRIAISWLSGYFIFSLFTPVLFKYQGPELAGQMGMTWSLVSVIGMLPATWVAPKIPVFGVLVAQRNYAELDRIFRKLTAIVVAIAALGAVLGVAAVSLLYAMKLPIAQRMLPPVPTALFALAQVLVVASTLPASYLRAHKREPLIAISVGAAVAIATSTLLLGRSFGATGIAWGYLGVNAVSLAVIVGVWRRLRVEWHSPARANIAAPVA